MRTRRTFTREFKREAACLILDQGFSVRDVCNQLDLQEGALRRWVQQVRFERNGGVPETAALTELWSFLVYGRVGRRWRILAD